VGSGDHRSRRHIHSTDGRVALKRNGLARAAPNSGLFGMLFPLVIDGKLHYAWLQSVERRWVPAVTAAQLNGAIGSVSAHVRDKTPIEIKKLGSFCQIRS
jgi:hypothetical protein